MSSTCASNAARRRQPGGPPPALLFLITLALTAAAPHAQQERPAEATSRLEVVEDLSESLANDLLDLSLTRRPIPTARSAPSGP
jgi:hypothetical protein